jgi:hypothetical protein
MLRSFIPQPLITKSILRRSFAAGRPATEMDDMEHGFALELKKAKAAIAELYAPPELQEEPSSEFMEEMKEAAIKYNKESQKEANIRQLDLKVRILLKKEAMAALPENFDGCLQSFDSFKSPLDRIPPTETPPIPGFQLFKEESE